MPNENFRDNLDREIERYLLKNIQNTNEDVKNLSLSNAKIISQLEMLLNVSEKLIEKSEVMLKDHKCDMDAIGSEFDEIRKEIQETRDMVSLVEKTLTQKFGEHEMSSLREKLDETKTTGSFKEKARLLGNSFVEKAIPVGVLYALFRFLESNTKNVLEVAERIIGSK